MSHKINCWEFRNCGMEPGGIFARLHGECKVPKSMKYDGVNGGRAAGRTCWLVMNDSNHRCSKYCLHSRQSCTNCEFYIRVMAEEELSPAPSNTADTFASE